MTRDYAVLGVRYNPVRAICASASSRRCPPMQFTALSKHLYLFRSLYLSSPESSRSCWCGYGCSSQKMQHGLLAAAGRITFRLKPFISHPAIVYPLSLVLLPTMRAFQTSPHSLHGGSLSDRSLDRKVDTPRDSGAHTRRRQHAGCREVTGEQGCCTRQP